ncbi:hypothetical protein G6F56_004911 [Rhizopus delemar]|nr:hypothetical protein G6F56_004911 [Rhizopus delemar]
MIKITRRFIREASIDGNQEETDRLYDILAGIEEHRVFEAKDSIPKISVLCQYILEWSDEEFKKLFRMEKHNFENLVSIIENNSVFHSNSLCLQMDVHVQLAVTLKRLSHDGTANSVDQLSMYFGISKGSVTEYIRRCFIAITEELGHLVQWPDKEQRALTSKSIKSKYYFRKCIGYVDGTHFRLSQRPTVDGETYYNRKGFYSLNCQIFCDERKIIFGLLSGQAGSVADSTCVNNSTFLRNPDEAYFSIDSTHEYLIADSGYALHPYMLTPYRRPQIVNSEDNQDFNILHSSARVAVENAIGVLKGRWRFLKNIPIQLNRPEDVEKIDESIYVCVILHNYLIVMSDATPIDREDTQDVVVEESDPEVVQLADIERDSTRGNTGLNRWRNSVRDMLIADFVEDYSRRAIDG